jgi:mannose-6-phosphate isomerase-like protein (cupin superfamily)
MSTTNKNADPVIFNFAQPENFVDGKKRVGLGAAGMITASVQYIAEGGDTNLHAHSAEDEAFLVLSGRARFYGVGDVVFAEIGPNEGLMIPRGFPYWFESASDDVLAIYKVGAKDPYIKNERLNYDDLTDAQKARGDQHPLTGRVPTEDERRS